MAVHGTLLQPCSRARKVSRSRAGMRSRETLSLPVIRYLVFRNLPQAFREDGAREGGALFCTEHPAFIRNMMRTPREDRGKKAACLFSEREKDHDGC